MKFSFDEPSGLWVRDGSFDRLILGERAIYDVLEPGPGDVILDVGACFGSFTIPARRRGSRVIAFEPHPDNFALLRRNDASTDNVHAAITLGDVATARLFVNESRNHGLHSTAERRGRTTIEVPAVNFLRAIDRYRPNKIKLDAEGLEHELLRIDPPDCIERLVVEYHLSKRRWRREAPELHRRVLHAGFYPLRRPTFNRHNWTAIGAYARGIATDSDLNERFTCERAETDAERAERERIARLSETPGTVIRLLVARNPKRRTSAAHQRFEWYRDKMTVADYFAAGGWPLDLVWDASHGFIELENPT